MKAALILIALALALPLTAFADGISLTNQFGSIAISNAGITSTQSELRSFNGIVATKGHSLGSVSFSTGALISGSISAGGTFSSVGSTFVVTGNGNQGVPKGAIFTGAFTGPIAWTLVSKHGAGLTYTLSGTISGMLYTGRMASGTITETIFSSTQQLSQGIGHIRAGTTGLATPEPSTLSMLGMGLAAIAGLVKRKFSGLRTNL
jgi:PEP-CTERM motif